MYQIGNILAAFTMVSLVGFLSVGITADAIDYAEAKKCPGIVRVPVNTETWLGKWAGWGQCPNDYKE